MLDKLKEWKQGIKKWIGYESLAEYRGYADKIIYQRMRTVILLLIFCFILLFSEIPTRGQYELSMYIFAFMTFTIAFFFDSHWSCRETSWGSLRLQYEVLVSGFETMSEGLLKKHEGILFTVAEQSLLEKNAFLFLGPYFCMNQKEEGVMATKKRADLARPLLRLIGKREGFLYDYFLMVRKFLVLVCMAEVFVSLAVYLVNDPILASYGVQEKPGFVVLMAAFMPLYWAHKAYRFQGIDLSHFQASPKKRAERALDFYYQKTVGGENVERKIDFDEKMQDYDLWHLVNGCASLEAKLRRLNPGTEELWSYVEESNPEIYEQVVWGRREPRSSM